MNIIKKTSLLAFALLMILASCREDVIDVDTTQNRPDPTIITGYKPVVQPLTSSVTGHVTNEQNENMENAAVTMGSLSTTTNEYGHFFFKNVEMNANGTFVQIEKEGYFDGSRRFYPISGNTSNVSVELLEKTFTTTFESNAGAVVAVEKGGTVEFPANAIVDEANAVYDGQVRIAARWLNPTMLATMNQMPGDLSAVNELNEEVALATFGMMAVELETPSGMPLNVAENAEATLTFPVPADIISQAPTEIPLWYFNERYGVWAQDGTATLQGNEYVGVISHFTFWNCDLPFPYITLDMTLVDANNVPLPNHTVSLTLNIYSGPNSASSRTDNHGHVFGKVPANEILVLNVYSHCNEVLLTENIGPFAADASLGNVVVTNTGAGVVTTVTGNLLNCDANPVTDGLVIAEFSGLRAYHYTDGTPFTFNFTTCPTTAQVIISSIDFDNPGHTAENTVTSGATKNLGDIDVCLVNGGADFIKVTIEGVQHIYSDLRAMFGYDDIYISSGGGLGIYIGFQIYDLGVGSKIGFVEHLEHGGLGWLYGWNDPITLEIMEYGPNLGDKLIGSFDGPMTDLMGNQRDVVFSFQITNK